MFADQLVVVRGGGDVATGVVWRLKAAGFPVIVTELERPMTVRRTVALSSAIDAGSCVVEGLLGRRVRSVADAVAVAATQAVPVIVHPSMPQVPAQIVVDARLAKRNLDTFRAAGRLTVGLGPGFTACVDCDAVVETNRGPRLGRVYWDGAAEPNTGTPGDIEGKGASRVLRSPVDGAVEWNCAIGDVVVDRQELGRVGSILVRSPFNGLVRGLIAPGFVATRGLKIGDIDPRADVDCATISDKALAVGGGVLEAVLTWLNRTERSPS